MEYKIDRLDAYYIIILSNSDIGMSFSEITNILMENGLEQFIIKYEANLKRSSDILYSSRCLNVNRFILDGKLYFPDKDYYFNNENYINVCIDVILSIVDSKKHFYRKLKHIKEIILPNLQKSQSNGLSRTRRKNVINIESKIQEQNLYELVQSKAEELNDLYSNDNIFFEVNKSITLGDIHQYLNVVYGLDINTFDKKHSYTEMRPDGGIVWMIKDGKKYPILISEAKKQGTNDKLVSRGRKKQSRGNAIERLGKNLDGFDFLYLFDDIFPVVVFGYGCDFNEDSSILGRVSIMNYSFGLNNLNIRKEIVQSPFKNKSVSLRKCAMMFRKDKWSVNEMDDIINIIINQSIDYFLND